MLDGDSINVVKKSGLVLVKGEVNAPGYLSYKKGESIKKYIRRAGGYSAFAEEIISPKEFSLLAKGWFNIGVQVIGGCCGLSPEHIQAVYKSE